MEGWYYVKNGQSVGPISLAELQGLLSTGQIPPDNQVWHESLPNWASARAVPMLSCGSYYAGTSGTSGTSGTPGGAGGVLGYQGSANETIYLTARGLELLRQTRPWVMFMAVLMIIGAALAVVGVIGMAFVMSISKSANANRSAETFFPIVIAIYAIGAALYIAIALVLLRFTRAVSQLSATRQPQFLEAAIGAQRTFWRTTGIVTIVAIGFYIVAVALMIAFR